MTFIHPTSLAWLGLALPIIFLYLIRVRPRELTVSTDQFWEQIFEERTMRSAWQRLRDPVSLVAQLALLAMIVLALAEPVSSQDERSARRLVVVVDNSASMNARDGTPTRLAQAQREAWRIFSGLRSRDEAALVVAGTRPRVACGLTADHRVLARALEAIEPSEGSTRLVGAVDFARHLLAGHPNAQVVVLTDGCDDGLADVARAPDVRLRPVGHRTANVGITSFQARRSLRDLTGYQVLITVGNYSDESIRCRLQIERNGELIDVIPLSIAPGVTWHQVLEKASNDGGLLRAQLDQADGLAADNTALAFLPPRQQLAVALVASGDSFSDLYVEKALEANPLVRQPIRLITASAEVPVSDAPVRVYHRHFPSPLPPGPALVLDPVASCNLWDVGAPIESPIVGKQDSASPLMAFVKLENAQIAKARGLTPKGPAEVLASLATGEPLYVAFDRPEGKVLVLAAALDDPGDLPLKTAFPILVGNALSWFQGHRDDLRESVATGAVVELTTTLHDIYLWPPTGPPRPLPVSEGRLPVGPLDQSGVWRVAARSDGPAVAEIACNLASSRESDLRPPASLAASPSFEAAGASAVSPWYALIFLAWASFMLEWFCYQRRWVR